MDEKPCIPTIIGHLNTIDNNIPAVNFKKTKHPLKNLFLWVTMYELLIKYLKSTSNQ